MDANWRERALCKQMDPELFFPVAAEGTAAGDQARAAAVAVCMTCPVRNECLRWALDTGQKVGVWGAATESDRRRIRRARTAADANTPEPAPAR